MKNMLLASIKDNPQLRRRARRAGGGSGSSRNVGAESLHAYLAARCDPVELVAVDEVGAFGQRTDSLRRAFQQSAARFIVRGTDSHIRTIEAYLRHLRIRTEYQRLSACHAVRFVHIKRIIFLTVHPEQFGAGHAGGIERQSHGTPLRAIRQRSAVGGLRGGEGIRRVEVGAVGQDQVGAGIGTVLLHHDVRTCRCRYRVLYHEEGVRLFGEADARCVGIEFRYMVGRTVIQLGGIDALRLVGGQHGIVVRAEGLAPNLYCLATLQQYGYCTALEIFVGLYCGACRVIGELTLSLVGTAGQVTAVADGGLSFVVLAYDGAHVGSAFSRDAAAVITVANVYLAVVAIT